MRLSLPTCLEKAKLHPRASCVNCPHGQVRRGISGTGPAGNRRAQGLVAL
jgi:hypothetical protein